MMELLAPAGSREALVAAVQNGADAVYFGGSILNARRFADNFAGDGLVSALDYCHERGVRAYITLNTLVFKREISAALDFARQIHRYGADAVLVQDIGLASLIRETCPELHVHASTQMGIHDLGGLRYCESMGITRAVLAREVALEEIEFLHENSKVELETFAHGALCMSFSGSCLYSSMSGERSGNRGTCAQPCRKCASVSGLPREFDRCLSPNDICMIEHLRELENAGVCCVKLEGRMKKPEYVATVTRCYRAALDGADRADILKMKNELFAFFNRGEFSTAHFFTDSVKTDRVGSSKPKPSAVNEAKRSMTGENKRRPVNMNLTLRVGERAKLEMSLGEKRVLTLGATVARAERPQRTENYSERLKKLGDTPFVLEDCKVDMTSDCYLSAAQINELRREAAESLLESFHIRNELPDTVHEIKRVKVEKNSAAKKPLVYCVADSVDALEAAIDSGAELIGVEPCAVELSRLEKSASLLKKDQKLILLLPNVIITLTQQQLIKKLIASGVFDGAEANNIGQTELIRKMPLRIAGQGMNALNPYSVSELLRMGYDYVVPSVELARAQFESLAEEYAPVLLSAVHERTMLMQLVHCPVKEHGGCKNCTLHAGRVTDEAGRQFPLETVRYPDKCLVRMLNCNITDLIDIVNKMPETAGYRLSFIGENAENIGERLSALEACLRGESIPQLGYSTRGHWNRKVD